MQIREQGWECPKCLRVWAPRIGACGACNNRQTLPDDLIPRHIPTKQADDFSPRWTCEDPKFRHGYSCG